MVRPLVVCSLALLLSLTGGVAARALTPAEDSTYVAPPVRRNFWRAAGETAGMNVALWAFDRYALKGHYAYISLRTIADNFSHGFEWDNDYLLTNMFSHPYHGSLYYNAGRANGYNFWQSELFAIAGSAMWELVMESEYPSTNDIIATPIGGAALGEVMFRLSDMITDDRATGVGRVAREAAAFVVSPMRGLNRLFTGEMWRRSDTSGRRYPHVPLHLSLGLGGRYLAFSGVGAGRAGGPIAQVDMSYGDPYADISTPYSYFTLHAELQAIRTQPLLGNMEIVGALYTRSVVERRRARLAAGIYQHFDYFDTDTVDRADIPGILMPTVVPYKLGAPAAFGPGMVFDLRPLPALMLRGHLHAAGILLGGVTTDFYNDYHRNYNWGAGYSLKGQVTAHMFRGRLSLTVADQFYHIFTWSGYDHRKYDDTSPPPNVQGDPASTTFNHLELTMSVRLHRRLYLSGALDIYRRLSRYHERTVTKGPFTAYIPQIESRQTGFHILLEYAL